MAQSPFRGLVPYSEEDAQFFFGREREEGIIIANLMASRLTLLYGASGVGKSSVLRAGVIPRLRKVAQQDFAERNEVEFAVVAFSAWRDDPIAPLKKRIDDAIGNLPSKIIIDGQGPEGLAEFFQDRSERISGDLLIILDQFEEYFLYHGDERNEQSFAEQFSRVVNRRDLRVNFLISMREDALAKLDRFKGRIESLFDNYLRIDHLRRKDACEAITKPIQRYNELLGENAARVSIESELVEEVLDQVRIGRVAIGETGRGTTAGQTEDGAGKDGIETPFLQLVMTRLWDEEMRTGSTTLRLSTLRSLGNADRIVRTHLDEVMRALSAQEQDVASQIFHYLVTPDATKIAYTAANLAGYVELSSDAITPVLDRLCRGDLRILRTVDAPLDKPGAPRFEIFHDVLAKAILDWRARYVQAQEKAELEKKAKEEKDEVERKAQEDAARQHDKQKLEENERKVKEGKTKRNVLIVFSVIFFVIAGIAVWQWIEASSQETKARVQEAKAIAESETSKVNWKKAEDQRIKADSLQKKAEEHSREDLIEADSAKRGSARSLSRELAMASILNLKADPELSLLLATKALAVTNSANLTPTAEALSALHRAVQVSHNRVRLIGFHKEIRAIGFSQDGKSIATCDAGGSVLMWDALTGHVRSRIARLNDAFSRAIFTAGSKSLAVWGQIGVTSIDIPGGVPHVLTSRGKRIPDLTAVATDGNRIAVALNDTIQVQEISTGHTVATLRFVGTTTKTSSRGRRRDSGIRRMEFGGHGRFLISTREKMVRAWDVEKNSVVFSLDSLGGSPAIACDVDGKQMAVALTDTIKVWDIQSDTLRTITGFKGVPDGLAFSPDGQKLAGWSNQFGNLAIWDSHSGIRVFSLLESALNITALAFNEEGTLIAVAGEDTTVRIWDTTPERELLLLSGNPATLTTLPKSVADEGMFKFYSSSSDLEKTEQASSPDEIIGISFSPDGQTLATASIDGTARIWDANSGKELRKFVHPERVNALAYSPDGKFLSTGCEDGHARVWDVASGEQRFLLDDKEDDGGLYSIAFSADGTLLATGSINSKAKIWNMHTRRVLYTLNGHSDAIYGIALSPDMKCAATASADGTAKLWSLESGRCVRTLTGHRSELWDIAFSPDSKRLATASQDGKAIIWQVSSGNILDTLVGHSAGLWGVAFSRDGSMLATTSSDQTTKIWDSRTGKEIVTLTGHRDAVNKVTFNRDGKRVATSSEDGTVRTYTLDKHELLELARQRVTRNFSNDELKKYHIIEKQ